MPLMEWGKEFEIGVESMDNQHRRLVDLINELHEAMKVGRGDQQVGTVLEALIQYTKTHFTAEEALMAMHGCPDQEEHRERHEEFVNQVLLLRQGRRSNRLGVGISTSVFLRNWLSKHIQGTDRKYAHYIQQSKAA